MRTYLPSFAAITICLLAACSEAPECTNNTECAGAEVCGNYDADGSGECLATSGPADAGQEDSGVQDAGITDADAGSPDDSGPTDVDCEPGEYVSVPATAMTPRQCTACAPGKFSTVANADGCEPWTVCAPGNYVLSRADLIQDRTCRACAAGTYSSAENTTVCRQWSECVTGEYSTDEPSATQDRACGACTPIADCASDLMCTDPTDQTCGACIQGYVLATGGAGCTWSRSIQFGTTSADIGSAGALTGNGDIVVAGHTYGDLQGANQGSPDAFIRRFDAAGTVLWTRQFGTTMSDKAKSLAVDSSGNSFVSGETDGNLEGMGQYIDGFIRKYDLAGSVLWTRQFGTNEYDSIHDLVVPDSNYLIVVGSTNGDLVGLSAGSVDAFIRSYDAQTGLVRWTDQFGSAQRDDARAVSADSTGRVYVAGTTYGMLGAASAGSSDGFLRQYAPDGTENWTRQFGTAEIDSARALAPTLSGGIVVLGSTNGGLDGVNAGSQDVYLRTYSSTGAAVWTRQFGTALEDIGAAVATDSLGNIYVTGMTAGSLGGANAGDKDVFVRKYDSSGTELWTLQRGSPDRDVAQSIFPDGAGGAYVVGSTFGSWPSLSNIGSQDVYIAHFTQ